MKKVFIVALTLALLVATTIPAMAAGGGTGTRNGAGNGAGPSTGNLRGVFSLAGKITAVDQTAKTVTVSVLSGNKLVKSFIGKSIVLQTTSSTRFLLKNADGTTTVISFDDLAIGQKVSANGRLANSTWTALRITVGAKLLHQ